MGLKSIGSAALMRAWFGPVSVEASYPRRVLWAEEGNRAIAQMLATGSPCMISRLGSGEVGVVAFYLRWRAGRGVRLPYPDAVKRALTVNAGFFPGNDAALDDFARLYLECLPNADVMAVWFNRGEQRAVTEYCRRAQLVELTATLPMLYPAPWSAGLSGKRVLVIHPFAATIESQYAFCRERLFADPEVLPEFELTTLIPPQTIAVNTGGFASWFDALADTQARVAALDFDVALIGAGAYGLPLAAFVKQQGRQAVHMGGATQLLFGIRGRRWERESADVVALLFNEAWVRPSAEETPPGACRVEGGCYW